jgi:hypothetical protein
MSTELQLKKVPAIVKALITREASVHRRSINQEAIVLLEEALLARAKAQHQSRDEVDEILNRFDKLPTTDQRPMSEIIEYDELGLPK